MRIFDSDNHYYEPYDAFTRYIEPSFADRAITVGPGPKGRQIVMVGDQPLKSNPAHPQDFVHAPGSLFEMFKSGVANDEKMKPYRMKGSDNPVWFDRNARLAFMDAEDISGCMLYPSLGVMIEQQLAHDIPATYANIRAFNRWLEDDWGFDDGRIYGVPMMSLLDVDRAVEELDRLIAAGARAVNIRPGPVYNGRSPAHPDFDPLYARMTEAGVLLAMHSSFPIYHELVSSLWGEDPDPSYADITPLQQYLGMGERPMSDTLAALVLQGLFNRFPELKVLSVESGSAWLGHLLHHMDHCATLARRSRVAPKLPDKPSVILSEHMYISPHPEDDLEVLASVFPASHIIFGSDYPHAEGLAHPRDYYDQAKKLGTEAADGIMGKNAAALVGAW